MRISHQKGAKMNSFRKLLPEDIAILENNRCSADNWDFIDVDPSIDLNRMRNVHFGGHVRLGDNTGSSIFDGIEHPCGIKNAFIKDCHIGDNVFISDVGSCIQNYTIGNNVIIQDVFALIARPGAQFGEGVQVSVLNEAGGRDVTLTTELTAQIAYLQAFYKHDAEFQNELQILLNNRQNQDRGKIEQNAQIHTCKTIKDVNIGPNTIIGGASELVNGTILSCPEHPTTIGSNVIMKDFIIAEGAEIRDGSILDTVYIGQGARVGKYFSAENTLIFSNCEVFQSEACSVFAGPFSVTHHKSTLLIGSLFSFYNAGSGTNLSNHMYKLGPVHQGIFERGCKTGSLSYILLESFVPAFCTVIGKQMTNINIPNFPFSYLYEEHSNSYLVPGKNLFSIGTKRDGQKWLARDRRKAQKKRDLINFDVYSPFTIEKMRQGKNILQKLYDETPKSQEYVHYGGVQIKRLLLRKGVKYYKLAIDRYLVGAILDKIEDHLQAGKPWDEIRPFLDNSTNISFPQKWVDMAGLLIPAEKVESIIQKVKGNQIGAIQNLVVELNTLYESYQEHEWSYAYFACGEEYGSAPRDLGVEKMLELVEVWGEAARSLNALMLADAQIEFAETSRIGYGLYSDEHVQGKDFEAVRGRMETNTVIKQCVEDGENITKRVEKLAKLLKNYI